MPLSVFDPDFKPVFLREVVAVPFRNGVIVDGTSRLQIFQGKASEELLPTLIKLMDGSRTVKELVVGIPGFRSEAIAKAISLLVRCGLVTDGRLRKNEDDSISNQDTLAFFRRCLHARHALSSPELAYENLRTTPVGIVESACQEYGRILRSALEDAGMTRIECLDRDSISAWRQGALGFNSRPLLVSLSSGAEDSRWHAELDNWCAEHQLRWLRSVMGRDHKRADLGPLFDGAVNPCFRCFAAMHGSEEQPPDFRENIPRAALFSWSGIVASEIIYLVSGLGPLVTGIEFQRYDLSRWEASSLRWARIPGCPRCRPLIADRQNEDVLSGQCIETAVVFEDYVGMQSLALSAQKGAIDQLYGALSWPTSQMSYSKQIKLSRDVPKIESSVLCSADKDEMRSNKPLEIHELSTLLLLCGGIRRVSPEGSPQRWSATAGNLGSVEIFVAAHRVGGLTSGFYRYLPREHALAHFQRRSGGISTDEFIRRAIPNAPLFAPEVLLIFIGAYGRVSQKYNEFAYRLINLDAGASFSQLDLAARSLGVSCHVASRWADDLVEKQLNLDADENCTAVVSLRRSAINPGRQKCAPEDLMPVREVPIRHQAREFCEKSVPQVLDSLCRESRVHESEVALSPSPISTELTNNSEDSTGRLVINLPIPGRGGRLLGDILACRKSVRQYTPDPVSIEQLSTMLNCASEADRIHWPAEHAASLPLSFLVLAFRVAGIAPGVYAYDPRSHGLYLSRAIPSVENASELFVQSEFSQAPLVFWIAGNLGAEVARHGSFGHRQLLLRAGAAAHRLWMAGMATGLSGCIVAGLVPGAAREQLGLDGYKQASLIAMAVGGAAIG